MKKWKEQWQELLPYEKYATVALIIVMAITFPMLIGSILQSFDIIQSPFDFKVASQAMMSVYLSCYAVCIWRRQRGLAIAYIVLAVLFAAIAILNSIWC